MTLAPHPFTLRQLQYALALSQEKSFRKAAERCRVSQPALSIQLATLETALGIRLFERDRSGVLLTPRGQEVLDRAANLIRDADALSEAGKAAADPLAGTLRLGIIPTISPYLLPAVAPALRRRFERLRLVWIEDRTAALVSLLQSGQLDAAIVALEAELGQVAHTSIADDRFLLALPPAHPLAAKAGPVRTASLLDLEMLLLDDGHCFRHQALEVCNVGRAREGEFRATSLTTLIQMVAAGLGATLLPELAVATETRRARIALRKVASPLARRTIALIWRRTTARVDVLEQLAAQLRVSYPGPGNEGR
jgi:LysR family hydrogen peroxide-inducible transcriptional activator